MERVAVVRELDAAPEDVRAAMLDIEAFMLAAGFTEVTVSGDEISIANTVGLLKIELTLEIVDRQDAALAYEQREGIFEAMTTEYAIEPSPEGSIVTAKTEFSLDVAVVGPIFDSTVVKRQRTAELEAQLDYLEAKT